jgi:hypothetical protein
MKIYLADQGHRFDRHLAELMVKPVMPFDKINLIEKTSSIEISTQVRINQIDPTCVFDYKIFPPDIMTSLAQWNYEKRKMQTGDTIVQQVYIPPFGTFSQKIIFGVRITEIIDEPGRKGFSYQTLAGHVERGESVFTLEEHNNGVIFKIRTFSEPGNLLTRLCGPFFTIPYQSYCTKRALQHVKEQIGTPKE